MKKHLTCSISTDLILALARMNKRFKKFVAFLLVLFTVGSSCVPVNQVFAFTYETPETPTTDSTSTETTEKNPVDYPTTTDSDFDISAVALLVEVDSLRTESTKTFQRVDGSYMVAVYSDVVHYDDNGEWKDIDNSLIYDEVGNEYTNKANNFSVSIPKALDENQKIKLSIGDYSINWTVNGINKADISYSGPQEKSNSLKELTNISQQVCYSNILPNVDLEYFITGSKVKENIILSRYIKDFSISFDYEIKNLSLVDKDGQISFVNESGESIFYLADLFAMDSNGEITENLRYEINQTGEDTFQITVSLDDVWASKAEFPVTIDPSISLPESGYIRDTYLRSGNSTSYNTSAYIYCGNFLYSYLGYINFTVPTYLKNYDIIYSTMNLRRYSGTGTLYLHELPNYIADLGTLGWTTNKPTAEEQLIDFAEVSSANSNYQLDITASVEEWNKQDIELMPGFELSSSGNLLKVYSIDSASYHPTIEIGFIDSNGIKDYWTYNSQDISYAGTGYISDYTQDLYFVRNDITFQTDLQSLGVGFVFNNNMAISSTPNIGYGNGWNISYNMKLYNDSPNAPYYTVDYTGNRTYYYSDTCDSRTANDYNNSYTCYISDDGSGSKFVKRSDRYGVLLEMFLLTKDNTKYSFTLANNDLISISNLDNPGSIIISRNPTNWQLIDYVFDQRGNKIVFSYGTSGRLESAVLKTKDDSDVLHELEKVYYAYYGTTNFLHDVYYLTDYNQDGDLSLNLTDLRNVDRIVRYDNYGSNLLGTAYVKYINETSGAQSIGEEIRYHYYSAEDPAVSYFESFYNSTKYSEVNYDYVENQTMITDHSGNFVLYSFDRYGHTVNILDSDANAVFYQYLDIFTDSSTYLNGEINYNKNHKIINQSSPEQMTYNPIQNYGFEDGLAGWYTYTAAGAQFLPDSSAGLTGEYALNIFNSNTEWGYARQAIILDKGIYNLSIDVKNEGLDTDPVYAIVGTETQYVPNDGQWHRLSFTIIVSNPDSTIYIYLRSHTRGSVFFDNLVWYEDYLTERINLIDNPSFEYGVTGDWIPSTGATITLYSINDENSPLNTLYEEVLGEYAVGVNGQLSTILERNYFEDSLVSGGNILVGGWALNYTAPSVNNANSTPGKKFHILIAQYDSNGENITEASRSIPFNLSYDNWQFGFVETSLDANCEFLRIGLEYQGEGEVLFDGLSVFFKASNTIYDYDDYGRVVNVDYGNETVYTYAYPLNDEGLTLIPNTITDQNGHSISIISVDNQVQNIIKNNVKTSPVYNSNGQITGYNIETQEGDGTYSPYYSTSTEYAHCFQYLSSSTDEYEETTTYYTEVINGLLDKIENSKGVDTNYEYYDDGLLRKVYVDNSHTDGTSYVEYIYDEFNNLIEIDVGGDLSYFIVYDSLGRIESVKVNNQTLMSYDYWVNTYETGQISGQTYGNGDVLLFVYDSDTEYVSEIQFQASGQTPVARFRYKYDTYGRVSVYEDLINNSTEYYEYDISGNLIKVRYNNGDQIDYTYDEKGNLTAISCDINDKSVSAHYFYDENIANPEMYDKTEYPLTTTTTLVKDYIYEETERTGLLGRLLEIEYKTRIGEANTEVFNVHVGYEDNLTRINSVTYHFQSDNDLDFQYEYQFDGLGNIIHEVYREYNSTISAFVDILTKDYLYDDLNQLIQEDSRDTNFALSTYSPTNYSKFYDYDERGNITKINTLKHGQEEIADPVIPDFYQENYGWSEANMMYNDLYDYQDIYNLNVGQNPTLSFRYFDPVYWQDEFYGLTTTMTFDNLDIWTPGYYYREYLATDNANFELEFRIVFKVGDPVGLPTPPQEQVSFDYYSTWKDQIESYEVLKDGVSKTSLIEYDLQGNPIDITNFYYNGIKYSHAVLSWDGRQLATVIIYSSLGITAKTAEIWYSYNDQGIRVSKILDTDGNGTQDKKYLYVLSGDLVISEIVSHLLDGYWEEDYQINYIFDYDGSLIGFEYCHGTTKANYLYVTNLQGDVTKIIGADGTVYVEYTYDAYGNITSIDGTLHETIGQYNSYRYRSYMYDPEIGIYYLNSRYYNPEIGRFINADGMLGQAGDILSTNMYAYCANNPVMYSDITGYSPEWWQWALSGAQIALGILMCATGIGAVAGVSLLVSGVSMLASNTMSALGLDDKLSMQIQSGLNVVAGIALSFVPGMGGLGASMIGAGIVGFAGGYVSEALGGSYALGWGIGNIVGGIAGGMAYKGIINRLNTPSNMMNSFSNHPNRWKLMNEVTGAATGRAYRGGTSVYRSFQNIYTGGELGTHTITVLEKVAHYHFFFW